MWGKAKRGGNNVLPLPPNRFSSPGKTLDVLLLERLGLKGFWHDANELRQNSGSFTPNNIQSHFRRGMV